MQASPVLSPRGSELEHKFTQVNFETHQYRSPAKDQLEGINQSSQTLPNYFMSEKFTQINPFSSPEI